MWGVFNQGNVIVAELSLSRMLDTRSSEENNSVEQFLFLVG